MIPSWVARYVGIPFVSGGRDMAGCDCYGLVRLALREQFGFTLPSLTAGYTNACSVMETEPLLQHYKPLLAGGRVERAEPGTVAVILFSGRPSHLGLFTGGGYILHTISGIGAHCVPADHGSLRGAIEGIYRVSERYRENPSL
jgi:cell wall-associated NlpC family hydrolase